MPTVETIYTAKDETGGAISSVRDGVVTLRKDVSATAGAYEDYGATLRAQQPALRDAQRLNRLNTLAFTEQHEVLFTSIDLASGVGRSFLKLSNILVGFNTMQIRVADQEERLNDAQMATLEALRRYGPNSKEYLNAVKRQEKETEKLQRVQQEAQLQTVAYGVATLSMASDFVYTAKQANKLRFALSQRGGLGGVLRGAFGRGGGAASLASGISPLAGARGGGFLSKIGGLKGAGAIGGAAIGGFGLFSSLTQENKSANDKLINTLTTAGGFALTGAMAGPIGAAIGGGVGLALGLATNYGEEFSNLFAGKGFMSNQDLMATPSAAGGGVNMQGSTIVIYTNSIADANQLKRELEMEARKNQVQ